MQYRIIELGIGGFVPQAKEDGDFSYWLGIERYGLFKVKFCRWWDFGTQIKYCRVRSLAKATKLLAAYRDKLESDAEKEHLKKEFQVIVGPDM